MDEETPRPPRRRVAPLAAAHCRAARGLLGWSRAQLAAAALVAERTVALLEAGSARPHPRAVENVRFALRAAGIRFGPDGFPLAPETQGRDELASSAELRRDVA